MKTGVVYQKRLPEYGRLQVVDIKEEGEMIRLLLVDDVRESAMHLDPELRSEPVFKYQNRMKVLFDDAPWIHDTLMFGGAGFIYPKVYLARYPERNIDVVELMPQMEEIARQFFFLEDDPRLQIHIDDAIHSLEESDRQYDVIFNDAFIADRMDRGLQSSYSVGLVKKHLRPDGIYAVNLLGEIFGEGAMPGRLFRKMLVAEFENTLLLRTREDISIAEKQNFLLIASDRELGYLAKRSNELKMS